MKMRTWLASFDPSDSGIRRRLSTLTNWPKALKASVRDVSRVSRRRVGKLRTGSPSLAVSTTDRLEPRLLLTIDFGDAPDMGPGTGSGNYATLASDNGPSHTIVTGLSLGASVDSDDGTLQNAMANADDIDGALPDDEDGVLSPFDLRGTIDTAPTVTLLATNTTGSEASLYGWIDYNQDGVFDNSTERTQIEVPDGTSDGRFTLTFPTITEGLTGTTYARFRLSTDLAASDATGAASDGEVEDYRFSITTAAGVPVTVDDFTLIADGRGGLVPTLERADNFGSSVAAIGDLNGDGVTDLVVGADQEEAPGGVFSEGVVYVLLMNSDNTVNSQVEISNGVGGLASGTLGPSDFFGNSVAAIGDLDGDGIPDLVVGAYGDENDADSDILEGAVYVLFMNTDGTVKGQVKITDGEGGLAEDTLDRTDYFGSSVASLGDLDGDGVTDLAVGAVGDDSASGVLSGAVYVLFMNSDGTVRNQVRTFTGAIDDRVGASVSALGDVDGDGVTDLAVGSRTGGTYSRGEVYVLLLNNDGTTKDHVKFGGDSGQGGLPFGTLPNFGEFGQSVAGIGDVDGDGVVDLAAGIAGGPVAGSAIPDREGEVLVLLLTSEGTVKQHYRIGNGEGGLPNGTLDADSGFGYALAALGDINRDGVTDLAVGAVGHGDPNQGGVYILNLAPPRIDYGDAPDAGIGTGPGNYATTDGDGGPSHSVVDNLFLGANVDADDGTLQNVQATADDLDAALPDDEDGVLSPLDLLGTVGAAPTITLLATNNTGNAATLYGWIDYDQDGVFDNSTERASVTVPDSTTAGRFTLTFPTIPSGSTGTTYARFRLSTDVSAQNSTGPASDGEVEDYPFAITAPSDSTVQSFLKIASDTNGGPSLLNGDFFGRSVTGVGDLDGDGVGDLAVSASFDDTGGNTRGAVHILRLNVDGTVKSATKITSEMNGGPTLVDFDRFGESLTSLGDLNGDGVTDLAVGALGDSTGGTQRGAVHVLLLNADGTVDSSTKITSETNGGPNLGNYDFFGSSVTGVGDLDGDGVADLVVGAKGDDTGGAYRGAVHVLLLNSDGTVKTSTKIASGTNGGPALANGDYFGDSVGNLGDLDGDGVPDLVVGAYRDSTGGTQQGAAHVLLLNSDGTVKTSTKIASGTNGGPALANYDFFGSSVTGVGDLDGDGVSDLVVGAAGDDTFGRQRGAIHVLLLNSDGTAKSSTKIASGTNGGPTLANGDFFGGSVANLGDQNGDGVADLVVGAPADDTGGLSRGAVYILNLAASPPQPASVELPAGSNYEVLRDGDDLVLRLPGVPGLADLFRQSADSVSVLEIQGSAGDDTVTILDSGGVVTTPIVFAGGDGNDRFDASLATGVVNLTGNAGDDVLLGGSANDTLNGGSGKDELVGNAGDDLVQGQGSTGDTLDGGDGNDTLNGGSGNDLIRESFISNATLTNSTMAGRGSDTVISAERAELTGGGAAQVIDVGTFFTAGLTSVTLDGGGGNDTLLGSDGSDVLIGSGGSDRIEGNAGNDRIIGGAGADTLIGGSGDDFIKGLGGSGDRLSGGDGNDTLNGGRGIDRVIETGDVDFTLTTNLLTGLGTDIVQAIEVAELNGGDSDNVIDVSTFFGFRGFTLLRGYGGNDLIIGSEMSDVINGGDGNDTLLGKAGDDTLNGEDGNDGLSGFTGNDVIYGGRGFDREFGGEGDDSLLGGNAADTLIGGSGDDTIAGNDGTDTLVGGTGNDDASVDDVFNDVTAVIDETFRLDPLPGWVDQV